MKIYFLIGAIVVVILISVYIFMEKQNPKEPITMSGYFEIDPIIGMLGHQGLYFFDESQNGMVYKIAGNQIMEISEKTRNHERIRAVVTGTTRIEKVREPVLGETDQFTGKYEMVRRNVLELMSYKQI